MVKMVKVLKNDVKKCLQKCKKHDIKNSEKCF